MLGFAAACGKFMKISARPKIWQFYSLIIYEKLLIKFSQIRSARNQTLYANVEIFS